jgi:hypothetical protein
MCACQLDISTNIIYHHGELLIQNGALVELKWVLQEANMSTNLVKLNLTRNFLIISKFAEIWKKLQ